MPPKLEQLQAARNGRPALPGLATASLAVGVKPSGVAPGGAREPCCQARAPHLRHRRVSLRAHFGALCVEPAANHDSIGQCTKFLLASAPSSWRANHLVQLFLLLKPSAVPFQSRGTFPPCGILPARSPGRPSFASLTGCAPGHQMPMPNFRAPLSLSLSRSLQLSGQFSLVFNVKQTQKV